jgi:hypothetical protein
MSQVSPHLRIRSPALRAAPFSPAEEFSSTCRIQATPAARQALVAGFTAALNFPVAINDEIDVIEQ